MAWMKTALSELVSLFVEDGSLALAILIWLALAGLVVSRFDDLSPWQGAVLFAGLALILVENTWRRARGDRTKRGG
jgi:membrane protein implicated in regulation of membrane protease activity